VAPARELSIVIGSVIAWRVPHEPKPLRRLTGAAIVLVGCSRWRWPDRRGHAGRMEVLSSRLLVRPRDHAVSVAFYRDVLGLAVHREFPGGVVFFLGHGLLESPGGPNRRRARPRSCGCRCAISRRPQPS